MTRRTEIICGRRLSATTRSTPLPGSATRAPKRGFTLIELLVVIGIIAILVGLLGRTKMMSRWKLRPGIGGDQEIGQPPHGFQASGPTVAVGTLGQTSPGNGQFISQRAAPAMPVRKASKVKQEVSFTPEPETQATALSEITSHPLDHAGTLHSL